MEVTLSPTQSALEGRTIEEIARERGIDPIDALLDIGLADDLQTTFIVRLLNVDEKRVGDLIADDGNMISLSDAGAHLTLFCDAGYAMHYLAGGCANSAASACRTPSASSRAIPRTFTASSTGAASKLALGQT